MPETNTGQIPVPLEIWTCVNGTSVRADIHAGETLLEFLRDRLGLTGAKSSCGVQVCGTCTVLMDGQPFSACCTLAYEARNREILTIEGLTTPDGLHPLQEAFIRHSAFQCGFCTPGMILTAKSLLGHQHRPTPEELRSHLIGNLCRCTGYYDILEAIQEVGRRDSPRHQGPPTERSGFVGKSVSRVDAISKVTGAARFTGDLRLDDMAHGKVLRSLYPHARILGINAAAAEALPGVLAVLTGADLTDIDPVYGHIVKDRPVVALDHVRFVGEPIAAVAAEDEATAELAVTLIDVDYEPLPAATTLEAALAEGAPLVHALGSLKPTSSPTMGEIRPQGNVCYHDDSHTKGDPEAVVADAAVAVEGEYTFPAVYQYAMEPHTSIAQWDDGKLIVHSACQHPYQLQKELAGIFELPLSDVRVIVTFLGGGFGSKTFTKMEPIAAALARKARRPVLIANRVDESMVTSRRHNMKCWMRTSAAEDGRLLARQVRLWLDTGAYADTGPRVTASAADAAIGPYRWQSYQVDASCIYTHRPPAGSYRAFGAAHLQWIGESQVDEIARRLSLDAIELREKNLLSRGDEVRPGGTPMDADLALDLRRVADALGWGDPKPDGVGRGVSIGLLQGGALPISSAAVRLESGGATILVGTTELGQGARTVFAQIVADALALTLDRIDVPDTDTSITPYDLLTGASRSTTVAGLAVQRAAHDVRRQVLEIAGDLIGAPPERLSLGDQSVWDGEQPLSLDDLFRRRFPDGGEIVGHGKVDPDSGTFPVFWEVCLGGAEVEVDRETGSVRVRKLVSLADVGKAINPRLVESQEMGATTQGLGNTLFEEMIFENGQLLNNTLLDYQVPTTEDLPASFRSILVENGDGPGPDGAKGVGEGAQAGVPGAIVNALGDLGLQFYELPLTPERVWWAIRRAKGIVGAEAEKDGQ